jgi:hypothetical protein
MQFKSSVFEKLLFPLHKRVYREIQDGFDRMERQRPGQLAEILANYRNSPGSGTLQAERRPGPETTAKYPSVNIAILYSPNASLKLSALAKAADYRIDFDCKEQSAANYRGNHLAVGFYRNGVLNSFIIPVEYLLGFNEALILRDGSYQLYSHTLLPKESAQAISGGFHANPGIPQPSRKTRLQRLYQDHAYLYIGITKRTWQERYKQHWNDSRRGSHLLFHRALRDELCRTGTIEHIVERAGLTGDQALALEETEVENRSLASLHERGLNMIPGGKAGIRFIHQFAKRTNYALKGEISADTLESVLVEAQKAGFNRAFHSTDIHNINAAIARLWAEDMEFRIKATTNHHNRFSYKQIQAARIWDASGWPLDKILEYLQKLDARQIGREQLERLLRGETYASIPDVLL